MQQQGFCFGFVEFEVASAVQSAIEVRLVRPLLIRTYFSLFYFLATNEAPLRIFWFSFSALFDSYCLKADLMIDSRPCIFKIVDESVIAVSLMPEIYCLYDDTNINRSVFSSNFLCC